MTNLKGKILRMRSQWRRFRRLCFPSPAEIQFIKLMGGITITFKRLKQRKTGFPFTIVVSLGELMERKYVSRERRIGKYHSDFANHRHVIEIDGSPYHNDIVKDQERDDYLHERGYSVLRIPAWQLYHQPEDVKKRVERFLGT